MDARLEREIQVRGYELDATGRVSPATLLRYLEGVRWEAIRTLEPVRQLFSDGRFTVVRAQRLEVERDVAFGDLLVGVVWPGKLGRSSVELRHELRLADSGERVAAAAVVGVHLDSQGKPCPLPDLVREVSHDDSEWLPIPPLAADQQPAEDSFVERLRVRPSHLDSFRHVNHAQYVDWVDDTRQLAKVTGRLRRLSIDYRREAVLGDELTLVSWLLPQGGVGVEVRRAAEADPLCRARLELEAA
jgi:acyl-CoA thioesterase FadM